MGTLCDWAVTSKRFGRHRGLLVAKLLAMRQDEVEAQVYVLIFDFICSTRLNKIVLNNNSFEFKPNIFCRTLGKKLFPISKLSYFNI